MQVKDLQLKRALHTVLFVLLLMVMGLMKGYAVTIGDLNYSLDNSTYTATVMGHVDGTSATGELIIPSSVTYSDYQGITHNYSVTAIGNSAFSGCHGFTGSLIIPNSVTTIGESAFSGCDGFTGNLTIGNSVTMIDKYAFRDCSGFTGNLVIPNSVVTIKLCAFYNCSGFTGNLTIGSFVTAIGNSAFSGCNGFTGDLSIPHSVITIGENAFYHCSGFTGNLTIPSSVTTIGNGAFNGCNGFSGDLTIPNSVRTIGGSAFYYCSGFTGNLTIGNSLTTIENNAFRGCSGFSGSLIIGNSVTIIEQAAFCGCNGFSGSLTIPNSVTAIRNQAFENCSGFTGDLTIPNSVMSIGDYAFCECTGFTGSLTIGNSVTLIGHCAFSGCSGFTGSLIIPETMGSIGELAFSNCSGFTSMYVFAENPPHLSSAAFSNVDHEIPVYVPRESVNAYQNASGWNTFTNILGMYSHEITAIANPIEGGSVAVCRGARVVYDFEDGLQGWTFLKGTTGDSPNNWMHCTDYTPRDFTSGYGHNSSDGFMISESYISSPSGGSGTSVSPDNFLISPQIVLGGSIQFWASNPNDDYGNEHFGVFVSTTNNTNVNSFSLVQEWTLLAKAKRTGNTRTIVDGVWYEYSADLSAFSGVGYVAIRHYNCSNQWLLCIDDITIIEAGISSGIFIQGQTCTVTATPNLGYQFVNWTENGTMVSSNASYSFTVTGNRTLVANFVYYDGIGEQENFEVSLYPNPVHDKLIVEIVEPANLLEIFSIVGTLVYSQADLPCKMVIQMDGLVNGTYLVRFTKGTSVVTRIFVKQ